MTLSEKLDKILIQGGSWKTILGGLWVTIQISALALVLGTVLGALICLLRTRKNPIVRGIGSAYIAILRGTPVLMLLLLLYYGVLARAGIAPVMVAVNGMTVKDFTVLADPSTTIVCSTSDVCVISAVSGSATLTVTTLLQPSETRPDADVTLTASA